MAFGLEFKPTKSQELFLKLPYWIKEAFFGGGKGGGKSDILLIYPIIHKFHLNSQFKQLFLRRTHQDLKKEIVPRSYELYPKFGATFNQTDMIWTFPRVDSEGNRLDLIRNTGARIYLGHCENEKDAYNYDSMEINLFTPDELTSLTEFIYLYIGFTRVRSSINSGLPAIIRGCGTPGNIGHTFVRRRFVDPAPNGKTVIVGKGNIKRFYIHATYKDNPHIDPDYANSIEALPEAEKQAALGNWNAFAGQVFNEFREVQYPDEPKNALHVIESFEIPDYWPRIVCGDWGFAAMAWIGFLAIAPSGRVYLYRELGFLKTKIENWAPEVKYFIDKEHPKEIVFCQSAGQDRGQEHTIQQQIEAALECSITLSGNKSGSRVAGKMLLHEMLRWEPKRIFPKEENLIYSEELAQRIYRMEGEEAYKSYLNLFRPPEVENNLPKLQIFKDNKLVIQAIQSCVYNKEGKGNPEDVAEFEGDDPYDGLRYGLDKCEQFVKECAEEFSLIQKREELIQRVNQTKDFTSFYRNMRRVESESDEEFLAVKRYAKRTH